MTAVEIVVSVGVLALGLFLAIAVVLEEGTEPHRPPTDARVDYERLHYGAAFQEHINRTGGASQC